MKQSTLPEWLLPLADLLKDVEAEHIQPSFPGPPADARQAAVLMLFADGPEGSDLLLTLRASTLRAHAGQIAFPGGSTDPGDADAVETALREAEEEVGLDPDEVQVFGQLPILWLPPNNFAVTTVLGYWPEPRELHPVDTCEVEAVFRAPIADLMEPSNRYTVVHPSGWRGPAFTVDSEMPLWGFTAGVVSRLFAQVGWEREWDDSITKPMPVIL
ncbi:MAG: CoA pyrophosphatase [Actinomycetota bacterium]|nr:CoA pyrophosphatase [Actinomycetota bacterium]